MEIDFLGLNSPTCNLEQRKSNHPYAADAGGGGVEISLSLSTSSTPSLSFSELQRKKWEFSPCEKMVSSSSSCSGNAVCRLASYSQEKEEQLPGNLLVVAPPVFRQSAAAGFLYDLNDAAATVGLRNINMSPLCNHEPPASATMLYPFPEPDKVDQNKFYVSGNASTGNGYTPTVAMARRATLARFLEKRLHRMNQARASHMMKMGR